MAYPSTSEPQYHELFLFVIHISTNLFLLSSLFNVGIENVYWSEVIRCWVLNGNIRFEILWARNSVWKSARLHECCRCVDSKLGSNFTGPNVFLIFIQPVFFTREYVVDIFWPIISTFSTICSVYLSKTRLWVPPGGLVSGSVHDELMIAAYTTTLQWIFVHKNNGNWFRSWRWAAFERRVCFF